MSNPQEPTAGQLRIYALNMVLWEIRVMLIIILVNGLSLMLPAWLGEKAYRFLGEHALSLALILPLAYFLYLFCYCLVNALAKRIFIGPLLVGRFETLDEGTKRWAVNMIFTTGHENFIIANVRVFRTLRHLYYRLLGARMDYWSTVALDCRLYEPEMVEVGIASTLGMGSILLGHIVRERFGNLEVGKVRIGRGCVIGGCSAVLCNTEIEDGVVVGYGSLIGAGVRIGRGAIILNKSYVKGGQVIPPREVWGGVPARKIKDRPPAEAQPEAVVEGSEK